MEDRIEMSRCNFFKEFSLSEFTNLVRGSAHQDVTVHLPQKQAASGLFSEPAQPYLLFVTERNHGSDLCRPAGRNATGDQRHRHEQQRDSEKDHRIAGAHAVKQTGNEAG